MKESIEDGKNIPLVFNIYNLIIKIGNLLRRKDKTLALKCLPDTQKCC